MTSLDDLMRSAPLPRGEVLRLAASVLRRERTDLLAHGDAPLPTEAATALADHVARRIAGEPIAYLVGAREFYGRSFAVDRRVLIPRPETELLVDLALARIDALGRRPLRLLDAGTGSGAIAITIALERPDVEVWATDVSADALAVAAINARALGASVRLLESDWYAALPDLRFDAIVSNPPYIASGDRHLREGDLRFEPSGALTDGADGMAAIRALIAGASAHLVAGGWIAFEHGWDQASAVRGLLAAGGYASVASTADLAAIERVTSGVRGDADL